MIKKSWDTFYRFLCRMTINRVGVYTAQASFFIMLSIFPLVMLILNVIGFTSLTQDYLIDVVHTYIPGSIEPLIVQIINEVYENVSSAAISVTAIVAVWSASKGVLSVMFGLHNIYHVHITRNYFISRFISMIYTVFFVIAMIITFVLLIFGNKIFALGIAKFPALVHISILYVIGRYLISFLILFIFFAFIYRTANIRTTKFRTILPGSLFSALGWLIFSYGFSIYVDNFSNMSYMYGSLTAVVILMLWLYFCIYILFIGAEINIFFHNEIDVNYKKIENAIDISLKKFPPEEPDN